MNLPRWTVYPALVVLAVTIVMAVPKRTDDDPYAGAASYVAGADPEVDAEADAEAAPLSVASYKNKPLVVLGIDGMDPDILAEVMELYPEDMQNFAWLIGTASGIQPLGTSTPPQSPVAWSNFITGQNPGGHGVFDFIHRDRVTRAPTTSTTVSEAGRTIHLPGQWKLDIGGDVRSNRTGIPFWEVLRQNKIPADIWRVPANFPVEESMGVSFSGMMTPTLDSAYGECSFITTDPNGEAEIDYEKVSFKNPIRGKFTAEIVGPPHPFMDVAEAAHDLEKLEDTKEALLKKLGLDAVPAEKQDMPAELATLMEQVGDAKRELNRRERPESVPLAVTIDEAKGAVLLDTGIEKVILRPGQWSDFVRVEFKMLPMGLMSMSGICRFYLRSIEPSLELYVSAVNFDPESPAVPVSEPSSAAADLAAKNGRYYTQGMPDDVNALKNGVLSDGEFMQQVQLVYEERRDMLDYAMDLYLENDEGGLLFFYFSTVDLSCHMMWRHFDAAHPFHDPEIANEDSSWWTGDAKSTWKTVVYDLYRKMDPVLGQVRARLGDDVALMVMSDHGFAPWRRRFDLNRWLYEEGYLVLKEGFEPEKALEPPLSQQTFIHVAVDWTKTRAFGMGFNGLYLNRAGRELDNPATPDIDETGIVQAGEVDALLAEIKAKLEAIEDPENGLRPVLRADIAAEIYTGDRIDEAPDILVGYNAGYGNSDAASSGRVSYALLEDNKGGSFNGNHLMSPDVVAGILISNRKVLAGDHRLEDLTVEILKQYGIEKPAQMEGHPVLVD